MHNSGLSLATLGKNFVLEIARKSGEGEFNSKCGAESQSAPKEASPDADPQLVDNDSSDTDPYGPNIIMNHPDMATMLWDFTRTPEPWYEIFERVSTYIDVLLSKASQTMYPTMRQLQNAKLEYGTGWCKSESLTAWNRDHTLQLATTVGYVISWILLPHATIF